MERRLVVRDALRVLLDASIEPDVLATATEAAEAAADGIRRSTRSAVANVESVQVEFAPDEHPRIVVAVPLNADGRTIASDLGSAATSALLTVDAKVGRVDRTALAEHSAAPNDPGRAIDIAVTLARAGAERVCVRGAAPNSATALVLAANAIAVLTSPDLATLADARAAGPRLVALPPPAALPGATGTLPVPASRTEP